MRPNIPIGQRFGRLVVLGRAPDYVQPNGRHRTRWACQCDCGNVKDIACDPIKDGRIRSCGCLMRETASKNNSTHGMSKTRLYNIWCGIKARCFNPNFEFYNHYGGRGIGMCDEWVHDFEAFYKWAMENGYEEGLTIDRTDNNAGYSPDNCAWVPHKAQCNNRRSNVNITYMGETHNLTQWCEILGLNYKKVHQRIHTSGWSPERAFTT